MLSKLSKKDLEEMLKITELERDILLNTVNYYSEQPEGGNARATLQKIYRLRNGK